MYCTHAGMYANVYMIMHVCTPTYLLSYLPYIQHVQTYIRTYAHSSSGRSEEFAQLVYSEIHTWIFGVSRKLVYDNYSTHVPGDCGRQCIQDLITRRWHQTTDTTEYAYSAIRKKAPPANHAIRPDERDAGDDLEVSVRNI